MKNIWSLIVLTGLCASCTQPLDVPAREYISFRYPFFETIHFEQDKVFLTQYMPEIQGNTLLLSAQQGRVSDYERSEDSFFLESPIAAEGTGTLLTLKGNGEILGYGDRDYYSPTIPETESISYDTFSGEITFSEFWRQGSLSAPLNTELLELLENSKLVRIDELDANVELVKIIYSLSKEEFNESRTHYADDLGIGYISSTVFLPIEGFPSIFYNLTGNGDYTTATTYMITSAESTLSFEEVSITQESVFHARHLVKQDLTGFSDSSETLLTEAEWDQEIDRLKLEAQERAVAEETARLEALEQQRLAAEAEEAARLEALEQQRLVAEVQEQRRLTAEAEAAAEKQETALRALAPALALLDYIAIQDIPPTGGYIGPVISTDASFIQSEIPELEPELAFLIQEIRDYVYPEDDFAPDFIKGEELVSQLYDGFYENAADDEKRLILGFYANIYLAQGKYPEAIQIFEQMQTLEQLTEADQLFLNYSLGQLHIAAENWQEAVNLIEQWREDFANYSNPPAVGEWEFVMTTPIGDLPLTLILGADGNGVMRSDGLEDAPIGGITYNGNAVRFAVNLATQDEQLPMDFSGRVFGSSLEGEFMSEVGGFAATGTRCPYRGCSSDASRASTPSNSNNSAAAAAPGEEEMGLRQLAFAYFKLGQPDEALAYWLAAESMQVGNTSITSDVWYYLATFPQRELLTSTFEYLSNNQLVIQDIREYGSFLEYQPTDLNGFAQDLENPNFVARLSLMQASTALLNTSGTDRIGEYSPSTDISPIPIESLDFNRGDYLPLIAIAPQYPTRAAQRGIEGWCLVSFTVNGLGNVEEDTIMVVDAEPPELFNRSSVRAAARFKFQPRMVRGEGISVPGVQYLFRFQLGE